MKRRHFISKTMASATGAIIIPTIIPSGVLGKNPPSDKINIGKIGMGRIARSLDTRPFLDRHEVSMIVACCDVDSNRLNEGKQLIDKSYADLTGNSNYSDTKIFEDYREMLLMSDLDAVVISTPDHWHVQPAVEAAIAGKDVFMQKPTSLTVTEGRLLSDVLRKKGTVFQMCTQHRTSQQFRIAAELVRNGRIGKL